MAYNAPPERDPRGPLVPPPPGGGLLGAPAAPIDFPAGDTPIPQPIVPPPMSAPLGAPPPDLIGDIPPPPMPPDGGFGGGGAPAQMGMGGYGDGGGQLGLAPQEAAALLAQLAAGRSMR